MQVWVSDKKCIQLVMQSESGYVLAFV